MTNPASPCISVCKIHPETGYCLGCYRNEIEIQTWWDMNDEEKATVYKLLTERAEQLG